MHHIAEKTPDYLVKAQAEPKPRTVSLFRNGANQAVRIPKEFELPGSQAVMRREGSRLIIEAVPTKAARGTVAALAEALEALRHLEPVDEEIPGVDAGMLPLDDIVFCAAEPNSLSALMLDTNIIFHMMRDTKGQAAQRAMAHNQARPDRPLYASVMVQCELEYGLAKHPSTRLGIAYQGVMASIEVLPITAEVTTHYAQLRTQLEVLGTPIGPNDALIAAHALAMNATLVTGNADFLRVPGLRVENWLALEEASAAVQG